MKTKKKRCFRKKLKTYWYSELRHSLEWRQTSNPWELFVAEGLLRKTTSAQAEAVFKVLVKYTAKDTASISIEELERMLYPFSMNKLKAEQLKEMVVKVKDTQLDQFESDEFLRSMRRVGHSISNSLRGIVFDIPVPAIDMNMLRVIERVFGWYPNKSKSAGRQEVLRVC